MSITDPKIPLHVLDGLKTLGIPFAVIHREELIGKPALTSDVDVALGIPFSDALHRLRPILEHKGLLPAVAWPYDVGGAIGLFVTTRDGAEGAQIDLLYDPLGRGHYGVRSGVLVSSARPGVRYSAATPLDRLLYSLRKDSYKGRADQVEVDLVQLRSLASHAEIMERIGELFSRSARQTLGSLLQGNGPRVGLPISWRIKNLVRLILRVRYPVGTWAELLGPEEVVAPCAAELRDRFGRWLLHAETGRSPRNALPRWKWWLREVLPVKLRPALFLSWTDESRWPQPDVSVRVESGTTIAGTAEAILDVMVSRIRK